MKQCRECAKHNSEVKALLPQLEELLLQQSLPDGSKPVLQELPTIAAATAAAAAAT